MSPHEKAVAAINRRLERLQANLREARSETAQQFLFQSLVVTLGLSEALTDYAQTVGAYSQRRHDGFKQTTTAAAAQQTDLLKSARELLEQLKANPTDRTLQKQIAAAQKDMAATQKDLRRGSFDLQRELALGMAKIDELAVSVRRLCETEETAGLKRVLEELIAHARELYAGLEATRSAKGIIAVAAWEKSTAAVLDKAADFHDAYARAGYQAMVALEVMILAVSENPPQTAEDATLRANEAAGARLKEITARLTDA